MHWLLIDVLGFGCGLSVDTVALYTRRSLACCIIHWFVPSSAFAVCLQPTPQEAHLRRTHPRITVLRVTRLRFLHNG